MRSFVGDLYPRFSVKIFRCAVSPVPFYGLFGVECLRAPIELSFSSEGFSSSFIRKIFGKRLSVRSLVAFFYLHRFVWPFLVRSSTGVLSVRSFAGNFYLRLFGRASLCLLSHLFFPWVFPQWLFSCSVLLGIFSRALIFRGNFPGNFRSSFFRSLLFRAILVRSFAGADSLQFLTGVSLAVFQRGFFPALFHKRFSIRSFAAVFYLHSHVIFSLCVLSQVFFPLVFSKNFFGVTFHKRFFCALFGKSFYMRFFCERFFGAQFRLRFSGGFYAGAFSMLVFARFFSVHCFAGVFHDNFRWSFFRPFSCRAFFVLSFVGADSMRFFADASPCAISLQFFNWSLS